MVIEGSAPNANEPVQEWDRFNGRIYFCSYLLIFLAGPVMYLGVVHAALCDRLGASTTVANLPSAAFAIGQFAPLVASWLVPYRWERAAVVASNALLATFFASVAVVLLLPIAAAWKIGLIVAQGLCQGLVGSTSDLFTLQCLGRGTTVQGRSRIFQQTFGITPIAAIAGSLGVQFLLNPGLPSLPYPKDFVAVFLIGAICCSALALMSAQYKIRPLAEEMRPALGPFLWNGARAFLNSRPLLLLWLVYFFWTCSRLVGTNVALNVKEVLHRAPSDFSGAMMAIQFGGKAAFGYLLGWIALRFGLRNAVVAILAFLMAGILWAWRVPGYANLLAFAFIGAAILGGAYVPNFVLTLSEARVGIRNLSILSLATPAAGFAPAAYGFLAQDFGFGTSFLFGLACAIAAAALAWKVRVNPA
jgi:MFS family permease